MDISIQNSIIPQSVQPLEQALKSLAENTIDRVLGTSNSYWVRETVKVSDNNRFAPEAHYHPYPEVAMVLDGECFFEYEGKTFAASCGDIAICQPGLNHSEGIYKRSIGYSILWMSGSKRELISKVSRYTPRKGWDSPCRWTFRDASVERLFAKFNDYEVPLIDEWYVDMRSNMFILLSNLYYQALQDHKRLHEPRKLPVQKYKPILCGVKVFIENHFAETITLSQLAQSTGMSPNYLNRLFRRYTGMAIHSYITQLRMEHAADLLRTTDMLAKQVAREVGYNDPLYFSRAFKKYHGRYPSETLD